MSINPNDPVVTTLKTLVSGYDKKLDDLSEGVQEAFKMITEGNAQVFEQLFTRLSILERAIVELNKQPTTPRKEGIEL